VLYPITDSFLPPVRDVLPFNRRHAPSRQSGIGSASHATQVASASFSGLPRYPAQAVFRGSSLPQVRSGRLSLYSPTRASIPESGISISNPIRSDNHKEAHPFTYCNMCTNVPPVGYTSTPILFMYCNMCSRFSCRLRPLSTSSYIRKCQEAGMMTRPTNNTSVHILQYVKRMGIIDGQSGERIFDEEKRVLEGLQEARERGAGRCPEKGDGLT